MGDDCILATCNLTSMAFQADRHVFPQHKNMIVQYYVLGIQANHPTIKLTEILIHFQKMTPESVLIIPK